MRITPSTAPPTAALVARYLAGDPFLADRLGGTATPDAVRAVVTRLRQARFDRQGLVASLHAAHRDLSPSPSTLASITALGDPGTFAVVTGQQPGLLTGPLYSIWKTITAIQLARRLNALDIGRFVPVFWVASDDHDLAEIEGCQLVNGAGELRRFRVELTPARAPSAFVPVPDQAIAVVDSFLAEIPDGPALAQLKELVRPRPGERWPTWFGRLLLALFPDDGLVLFEPFQNTAVVAPWLEREIERPAFVSELLRRGAEGLRAHSLEAPLPWDKGPSVFVYDGQSRHRLDPARLPTARQAYGQAAISADAGLRPALQSLVLPAAVAIGGPGELAYWIQLTEVFESLEATQPVFWPRLSATVLEARARRALQALNLDVDAVLRQDSTILEEHAASDVAIAPEQVVAWKALASQVDETVARFCSDLGTVGGSIPKRTAEFQKTVTASLERILGLAGDELRDRDKNARKRRLLLRSSLLPNGKLPERVLNGLPFLARAGLDFFSRLATLIDPFSHTHYLIDVDGGP